MSRTELQTVRHLTTGNKRRKKGRVTPHVLDTYSDRYADASISHNGQSVVISVLRTPAHYKSLLPGLEHL